MSAITTEQVKAYIEKEIPGFHRARLDSLRKLSLKKVLQRKNPYLYKAKNINLAADLVRGLLDAHLSSQEEGIFGNFLEGLALYVCQVTHGGRKSGCEGIDIEFDKAGVRYLVAVKSGPHWGNSSQIGKMKLDFEKATKILRTSGAATNIVAVNGCCYGRGNKDYGSYHKWCGQKFWKFLSNSGTLYTRIIEPLGHRAKERNEEFAIRYGEVTNAFTRQFIEEFCDSAGRIRWERIVRYNSSESTPTE